MRHPAPVADYDYESAAHDAHQDARERTSGGVFYVGTTAYCGTCGAVIREGECARFCEENDHA